MKFEVKKPNIRSSRQKKKKLHANQPKEKKKARTWLEKSCPKCGWRSKVGIEKSNRAKCVRCGSLI